MTNPESELTANSKARADPPTLGYRFKIFSYLVLLLGIAASSAVFYSIRSHEKRQIESDFDNVTRAQVDALSQSFAANLQLLGAVKAFYTTMGGFSAEDFYLYTAALLANHKGVQALEWAPLITPTSMEGFLAEARQVNPQFRVKERNTAGELVLVAHRPEYFPVYFAEPLKGNEQALGFDLGSNPERVATIGKARSSGEMAVSPRVLLVQEKGGQFGILVVLPIYTNDMSRSSTVSPAHDLLGIVVGVFKIGDTIRAAVGNLDNQGLDYEVHEGDHLDESTTLFSHIHGRDEINPIKSYKYFDKTFQLVREYSFKIADRAWTVRLVPSAGAFVAKNAWSAWAALLGGSLISFVLYMYLRALVRVASLRVKTKQAEEGKVELEKKVTERTHEINSQREKIKQLLDNMLPVSIATELQEYGSTLPRRHDAVTVLFTDFVGFTDAASSMPASRIIAELQEIFGAFDAITSECGIEKIKTIGDAYMAIAGAPTSCDDHAYRCVRSGLMMLDYITQRNKIASFKWSLRIGMHTGPAIAGVIGTKRLAYDVWGDTVNIASRMESASEDDRLNISAYTYDLVRDAFACEYRGKIPVKGKGDMDMYFVVQHAGAPRSGPSSQI